MAISVDNGHNGCSEVFPNSPHGFCMHHLHENFHKKFKHPDLGILLWQAARATTEDVYLDTIKKMRDINEKFQGWQRAEPARRASRAGQDEPSQRF